MYLFFLQTSYVKSYKTPDTFYYIAHYRRTGIINKILKPILLITKKKLKNKMKIDVTFKTYLATGIIFNAKALLRQKPAPPVANQNLTFCCNNNNKKKMKNKKIKISIYV